MTKGTFHGLTHKKKRGRKPGKVPKSGGGRAGVAAVVRRNGMEKKVSNVRSFQGNTAREPAGSKGWFPKRQLADAETGKKRT